MTAAAPAKLLPKGIYGKSVWTHLLLEKFHLQRPTHRTIEQLRLLGLRLAPGTVADGFKRIEPLLTPIYDAIRIHHLQSAYFHADETRWRVFVEKAGKVGHRWWLWLFAGEDSRIPLDNNYGERLIRNPAVGRKNYYGSGAEWAGRLAVMMFSICATLVIWKINPQAWLSWYFEACATNAGQAPKYPASFLPWNLSEERLTELRNPHGESFSDAT